jgi:hypothetical protein
MTYLAAKPRCPVPVQRKGPSCHIFPAFDSSASLGDKQNIADADGESQRKRYLGKVFFTHGYSLRRIEYRGVCSNRRAL